MHSTINIWCMNSPMHSLILINLFVFLPTTTVYVINVERDWSSMLGNLVHTSSRYHVKMMHC